MNAPPPAPIVRAPARLLSEQLEDLRVTLADRPANLRDVMVALEGRAYALLLILFALPFAAPISVPGSSTILGLIIAAIAVQLAFGRLPWLPRRMLEWRLPARFFSVLIPVTARIVRGIERVLHPCWPQWTASPTARAVHLLTITVAALLLSLPILMPLTNTFPAWTILLIACGLLERDGVFIAVGYLVFAATVAFFVLLGSAITQGLLHTWHWIAG